MNRQNKFFHGKYNTNSSFCSYLQIRGKCFFYERIGFKEVFRRNRGYDTIVILEGYGIQLEMFIDPNHPERATKHEQIGLRHLALKVKNIDEVARFFQCNDISKDWIGEKYFFIKDPDGLPIEIHE